MKYLLYIMNVCMHYLKGMESGSSDDSEEFDYSKIFRPSSVTPKIVYTNNEISIFPQKNSKITGFCV